MYIIYNPGVWCVSILITVLWMGLCAKVADRKGRNVGAWLIIGFLLGLIGVIIILCLGDKKDEATCGPISFIDESGIAYPREIIREMSPNTKYAFVISQPRPLNPKSKNVGLDFTVYNSFGEIRIKKTMTVKACYDIDASNITDIRWLSHSVEFDMALDNEETKTYELCL